MGAPFRIRQLDHLVLRVADLQRSVDFYCGILGCTQERHQQELGLMQLRAGGSLIDLVPLAGKLGAAGGAGPGEQGRNVDHFCLRIEPFDAVAIAAHLRHHGLDPGEPKPRFGAEGRGPSLYVTDPDGNVVELKGPPE
jgi:glyoxylase I family protein